MAGYYVFQLAVGGSVRPPGVRTSHRYLGSVIVAFKKTLTTTLNHKTCINTSGQGFKKRPYSLSMLYLLVNIALIANKVFFKTLCRSIIEDGGQGVHKRKNY